MNGMAMGGAGRGDMASAAGISGVGAGGSIEQSSGFGRSGLVGVSNMGIDMTGGVAWGARKIGKSWWCSVGCNKLLIWVGEG